MAKNILESILDLDKLYLGDNGRITCGDCSGASARYTGRDLSGQRVEKISPQDSQTIAGLIGHMPICEVCQKEWNR